MSNFKPLIVALFLTLAMPAFADDATTAETKAVWNRHVAAATAGDLDAVMADFGPDSAILTADGIISGRAEIRTFFEVFLGAPDDGAVTLNAAHFHGEIVYFNFTIGGAGGRTFHDTALVRDGKILVLATIDYTAN